MDYMKAIAKLLICIAITIVNVIVKAFEDLTLNATLSVQTTNTKHLITCYPSNKSDIDTVYFITISKEGFGDIVIIRDDNKIEWKNSDLQNRVSVNGSKVTPVKDAILIISIDSVDVQCTDSGVYSCTINGFGFGFRLFQQTAAAYVNVCPDVSSSAPIASSGDLHVSSSAPTASSSYLHPTSGAPSASSSDRHASFNAHTASYSDIRASSSATCVI